MEGPAGFLVKDMLTTELFVVEKSGKFGLADKAGKLVLDYDYDEISALNPDGFAHIKQGNKFGAINKYGKIVFPCIIEEVLYKVDSYAIVSALNKNIILDTKTYNKRCEYDEITMLKSPYLTNYALVRNGAYFGILDVTNNLEIVPGVYTSIQLLEESKYLVFKGNLKGILDKNGATILDCNYLEINQDVNEFSLTIQNANGKWGVVNKTTGRVLVPCEYDKIEVLNPNDNFELRKVEKEGKIGIYNTALKKEIVPCVYDSLEFDASLGLMHVSKDGKWGLLNEKGEVVVDCIADKKFEKVNEHFLSSGPIFLSIITRQLFTQPQFNLINQALSGKLDGRNLPEELISSARCLKEVVELARYNLKKHENLEQEDALKFADFVQNLVEQKKRHELSACKAKETGISETEVQEFSQYAEENIVSVTMVLINTNSLVYEYTGDKDKGGSNGRY